MHLPDGFLNKEVTTTLFGAAAVLAGISIFKLRKSIFSQIKKVNIATNINGFNESIQYTLTQKGTEIMNKMALAAALIFSLQMINFPVANGTSGHLLGGVLAAVVVGPWRAFLVITMVLLIQAIIFADGGIFALGANIINMGLIGAVGSGYVLKLLIQTHFFKKYFNLLVFIVSFLSVVIAAFFVSIEIALSGTKEFSIVGPAMIYIHSYIGLGEGVITLLFLFILKKQNVNCSLSPNV
jgi:cobalt/nickel transport system permease protein